ncbi:MAG: roadblock/LC7 domain-containing protein [Chloroflexota bacterium]|nr:roadblock/LC7 domain-containing protein [Chloroflexota bacterium]
MIDHPTIGRHQALVEHLHRLQQSTTDIEASAVVSMDGLVIASALPEDAEEDRVSAMSAALLALGQRIAYELNRGLLDQVFIRGTDGDVLLMAVGTDAVLTVMSRREAKLGLMLYYMKRTAKELNALLS